MAANSEAMDLVAGNGDGSETPSSSSPSLRLPRRLRRRVIEAQQKSPITAEHIEAKLEQAHLRRQRFYELLWSKARSRERASLSSGKEEELNKRLEAKRNAADQKRLSILERTQTRLAKLDELRKAAKAELETRFEKERNELRAKVQSRAKQAEENSTRLLKAYSQQRAARRDRITQLLGQKMIKERKYKDCVRASICQKRAAAARKRSKLLEEEKAKACAMILRVRRAVKSAPNLQEIGSIKMKDKLRAEERAEILKQQSSLHLSDQTNLEKVKEQAVSKIIRCWRRFVRLSRTTASLAKAFEALGITEESVKSMSFEQLALVIESPKAIQTTKALVKRLESWYLNSLMTKGKLSSLENIDHLLRRVSLPVRKGASSSNSKKKALKEISSDVEVPLSPVPMPRYAVRILLCSYVILGHPDSIFNRRTECENALASTAEKIVQEFDLLLKVIRDGPIQMNQKETGSLNPSRITFVSQIEAFDRAWCAYLLDFVAWKDNDSKLLEEDLVRAACELELSMLRTCKMTQQANGPAHDTLKKQVSENQKLLKDKLHQLSGTPGVKRMEAALSEIRSRYIDFYSTSSPASTETSMSSLSPPASVDDSFVLVSAEKSDYAENFKNSSQKIIASVENDIAHLGREVGSDSSSETNANDRSNLIVSVIGENELLVNEILHKHHLGFLHSVSVGNVGQNSLETKVRETLEKAFWDGVMDSLKENDSGFRWILKLVREVRDELCDLSPQAWKQEIIDSINIETLTQALASGNLDMDYFGKILEFALDTLRKLSAPASDDDMKTTHNKFLKELGEILKAEEKSKASRALAITKGLRFVLEQIQNLKIEISKARLRMVEPLIKGTVGFEYLRKAFSNRRGSPGDALTSLPITRQWLSSVKTAAEQEWQEHIELVSTVTSDDRSSGAPSTTLRTGGSFLVGAKSSSETNTFDFSTRSEQLPECEGERIDLLVRLGLLKLVSEVVGLTSEVLPETLELNLARLRAVQHQLQKIIVVSTCLLVLRQILLSEDLIRSPQGVDQIASRCVKQLSILVDTVEDAGLSEIIETIISSVEDDECLVKLHAKKQILASMLGKSLQASDPVFKRVSHTVYVAARGIVLGGNGVRGRELAETSLRRVGAALLTDDLVKAVEVLIVAATVTVNVHRPWYEELIKSI